MEWCSNLGSCHTGADVYLASCPTWAVVQPWQLSYLGSRLPGQLSPGQLSVHHEEPLYERKVCGGEEAEKRIGKNSENSSSLTSLPVNPQNGDPL